MTTIGSRHVLVTGAASGIGRLVARKTAALGATVTLWDIDKARLSEVTAEIAAATSPTGRRWRASPPRRPLRAARSTS